MTAHPPSNEQALADALLDLDAAHARIDELSDRVAELALENRDLRRQLATQAHVRTGSPPHALDRHSSGARQR